MFDLARGAVVVWALYVAVRARAWESLATLGVAAYAFGLAVWSGITIRDEGPQEPAVAMLLVFIGPSGMPRGHLPAWPLAKLATTWPAALQCAIVALLAWQAHRLTRRAARLPAFSDALPRVDAVTRAVVLLAVFDALAAAVRVLPSLLGGDL